MQDFLCRAKLRSTGAWIEGYYVCSGDKYHYIFSGDIAMRKGWPTFVHREVIPETVSRFSGFEATNGKIFEGHIILSANHYFIVTYGRCGKGYEGFYLQGYDDRTKRHINQGLRNDIYYWLEEYGAEIIGSVYDLEKGSSDK